MILPNEFKELFAQYYTGEARFSQLQAIRLTNKAFNSPYTGGNTSLTAAASHLMADPEVKAHIKEILAPVMEANKSTFVYQLLDKARRIAFADISDYVTPEGLKLFNHWKEVDTVPVKSVKTYDTIVGKGEDRETITRWEIVLHDPKPYYDDLAKYMSLFNETLNVTGTILTDTASPEERQKRIDELLNKR